MKLSSHHFQSNASAILGVLKQEIPDGASVLEIGSGSGEHVVLFAGRMPTTTWQPSDIQEEFLRSIEAHRQDSGLTNIKQPLRLEADSEWVFDPLDAIVSINLLHVSSWSVAISVFKNAGRLLKPGGLLFFYGPFIRPDVETASSNLAFNQRLKMRNPDWGVPELVKAEAEAKHHGIALKGIYDLPSNNVVVIFRKKG